MGQGRHKEENITRRQAEVMQEICRFFSIYRKMPTMQQVADAFGIATPTIYDIFQELVRKGYLKRIEKGALKPYVIKKTVEPEALVTIQIPVLGEIPGGVPVEEFEDRSGEETVAVDKALTNNGDVFALRVKGDSMIGAGIKTGDIVIIRHQPIAADGDIVVSDLRLPDGNGIDLLRWMRKEGMTQPFIIMTDYAEVHTAVESMKLGSLDYIPKQLVEDKLVPLLRTIVKERNIGRSRMPVFARDGSAFQKIMHRIRLVAPPI